MATISLKTECAVLYPEELRLLQGIFDGLCAERCLDRKSEAAEDMAAHLIAIYLHGLKSEELIRSQLAA
jgi:hypothetical protein